MQTAAQNTQKPLTQSYYNLVAIDPGLTTGIALFQTNTLVEVRTYTNAANELVKTASSISELLNTVKAHGQVNYVVMEDYRIYPNKAAEHIHSDVPTARLIGMIEYLCDQIGFILTKQRAADAKKVVTDETLKGYSLWSRSPHTRDATRHGVLFLMKRHIVPTRKHTS